MTLLVVGISLAIWLWGRHPRASEWLLAGTLGAAAVSRALVVVFALYDVKAIALLPVIDDMNHAMVPDVSPSSCLPLSLLSPSPGQALSPTLLLMWFL